MIGCLLATLGVFAIARWIHRRSYRYGAPCAYGGYGGHGGFGRYDRYRMGWDPPFRGGHDRFEGFGRSVFLHGALDPLEMTPAQERAVNAAIGELRDAARDLRGELKQSRKDIADAFRKSSFDEVLLGELYARHDSAIESLRKAFVGMGAKIHEALDEKQRARLADMIESGPRAFFGRWSGRAYNRSPWSW